MNNHPLEERDKDGGDQRKRYDGGRTFDDMHKGQVPTAQRPPSAMFTAGILSWSWWRMAPQ